MSALLRGPGVQAHAVAALRSPVLRALCVGAALGALCGLAPPSVPVSLAVLCLLSLPGALVLAGRLPTRTWRPIFFLFLAAVGLRAVVAVVIAHGASHGFFAVDDRRYSLLGWELVQFWAGQGPYPTELGHPPGYTYWNALLYRLFGYLPLVPAVANAAVGGYVVLLAHGLARSLADEHAARLAALLTAFWPSLVLWSSLNLKDAFAILAILLVLTGAQRIASRITVSGLLLAASGLVLLLQLRGYLVWVMLLALALAWALPRLRVAPLTVGALLMLAAVALPNLAPVQELAAEASLESLDRTRRALAFGGSAYLQDAQITTAGGALRYLPIGLAYFLFAPAPWQLWNARQLLTLPEMLAWYGLLPAVLWGVRAALRERFGPAIPLVAFALVATLSYALVEGNLGTAYRHRAQVMVLYLIFAAVGLNTRRVRHASTADASARPRRGSTALREAPA